MSELFHESEPNIECRPQNLKDTFHYPLLCPASWPPSYDSKKRIDTSRMLSPIEHNSESILNRNGSPLDCLHLALVCRYYFVWKRYENMSLCTVLLLRLLNMSMNKHLRCLYHDTMCYELNCLVVNFAHLCPHEKNFHCKCTLYLAILAMIQSALKFNCTSMP